MSPVDDVARLVDLKLCLCRVTEEYLLRELRTVARSQGRALPAGVELALRAGALAAVARLSSAELGGFASGRNWDESIEAAVASGAWMRLLQNAVRLAFQAGPG